MDNDLISRTALYDALKELAGKTDCNIAVLPDVAALIREAPAIDPDSLRPPGRWEQDCDGVYRCNNCWSPAPVEDADGDTIDRPAHCFRCGARMGGREGGLTVDNISEFVLDKDSAARIEKIIHMYPISLTQCADLLTGCIPLLEIMSGDDVVRIMTDYASCRKGHPWMKYCE